MRARDQVVQVLAGQAPVRREAADLEVHVALDRVREPPGDEPLDQRDHLRDVVGRLRVHVGREDADRGHVLALRRDVALRDLLRADALPLGALDDLVVHVGEVPHEPHLVAAEEQVAPDHVEGQRAPGVAHVGEVVHRDPADVDTDPPRDEGDELLLLAGERVVDPQGQTGASLV